MLKISLSDEARDNLRALLENENDPNARFRIREFKVGCGS